MFNKTILQGRLTRDPELKITNTGIEITNFTVAWSEKIKEKETKCFLSCIAFRQHAKFINNYFKKGQEIIVDGKLITREYVDKDNNKRHVTELICDTAHFCGSKSDMPIKENTNILEDTDSDDLPF